MCAKDRSQITVLSQTETIHSFSEMLNFSSCPSFIRNTQGEFLHTSPLFDKIFLTSVTSVAWFSALPLKTKIELIQSEIKEGANKQVISSQADSLIKISRIWADFFPANTSNQPI